MIDYDYNDYMSCLGTGLSALKGLVDKSKKEMSSLTGAVSDLTQKRGALYADVQKFNEQAKALKKARRAEKLEKIKNVFSTIGKGLLKTGKFLSLCAYSLVKAVGKGAEITGKIVETLGKGVVKGGRALKRASSRLLEKLRLHFKESHTEPNQQEVSL